ncbi:transcription elongation factor GreA [Nocardioides pocheonensis]|uniref:Transcription elongation factor GreA n=1 Tax=Nocardioides pocheonensis TaxID=661485 RepID=A0A3N0GKG0_9ACTN|nr:transcription elongation factor GreA [Nocardioides pocheonensis]RNM12967.1 transcription elongation factor GreA [Nocardioides pocheonensis]
MTQADERTTVWLTQAKYDALQAELEELRGPGRAAVVQKVSDARDEGDLKENGGYHAAREELGKLDGRIAQLEDMLKRAQVGETPADDGIVEPGMVVTYRFVGDDEEERFLLGAREMKGDDDDLEVYSPQSPLGEAINGKQKGDTVEYVAPNGKTLKVEIVEARPYEG